jgi:hypothetical protein
MSKLVHTLDKGIPGYKQLDKAGITSPGNLFFPEAPKIDAPKVMTMPTMDNETILAARKKSLAQQAARGGRQSTILTDYSSEQL